jgi:GNAT superfamily N-acetyltransferase
VHPDFQRRGIASLLLKWGCQQADEAGAKMWCMSTPQAIRTYEKNGWEVVDWQEVDLGRYGGGGIYRRAWMVRLPKPVVV